MSSDAAVLEKADPHVKAYVQGLEERLNQEWEEKLREEQELNRQWETKYEALQEELRLALYHRFGRSSEKETSQPSLFAEAEEDAPEEEAAADDETTTVKGHQRKKADKGGLDSDLPREEIVHDLPEEEKVCGCGCGKVVIGEEVREIAHVKPAESWVEKHIMLKYACHRCEGSGDEEKPAVMTAPGPLTFLPKSIASASLLSFIFTNKFVDHLPFYRQEKRFERMGIYISRQDMSNWTIAAARRLDPLIERFIRAIREGPLIQMDETRVQVMKEPGKADTTGSFMWLARGGPPDAPVCLYHYSRNRGPDYPRLLLEGYQGHLQSDGYEVYARLAKDSPDLKLAGCWAHARRKFHEADKAKKGKPGAARQGMSYIQKLYRIESQLRRQLQEEQIDRETFLRLRREQTEPVLENFRGWLAKKGETVVPSSLLGKAVGYTLGQWDKLIRYLDIPELTPDNNRAENAIRPFVLGRKNWLFSGSPRGAMASCALYSLIETAKQNSLNPYDYLNFIFTRIPHICADEEWDALLPHNLTQDKIQSARPS